MITLYSNNCPKCEILKSHLKKHSIEYQTSNNFEKLMSKGITYLPVIELEDGSLLNFNDAIKFIIKGDI